MGDKNTRKRKKADKNLRFIGEFLEIDGWEEMAVRKLKQAIFDIIGSKTFHQYVLGNQLGSKWERFKYNKVKTDRSIAHANKDKQRYQNCESAPLTQQEWSDSLDTVY